MRASRFSEIGMPESGHWRTTLFARTGDIHSIPRAIDETVQLKFGRIGGLVWTGTAGWFQLELEAVLE